MRINLTKPQIAFIMQKVAPEVIRYLQTESPTAAQHDAYTEVHKPLYDALRRRSLGDEV